MSKESIKQAVVLLETFTDNFKPFESNVCFLPFVNGKVSDYTFEWLGMSGVEEVILFSSNNENIQKSYAKQMAILQRFSVNHFVAKGCRSLGDVMRALDRHGIIRHNFILVSADVIGNVDCNRLFKKFEQIQTNDKGITMMMVYQNVGKDRYDVKNNTIIGVNSLNKLVYYQNTTENNKLDLPIDILLENAFLNVRTDVLNTSVAICSTAVPAFYSDNFDFQVQEDLIKEILTNADVLSNSLYCYFLEDDDYIAKIENWPAYQRVTHDIIHRWTYPIVPDLMETYNYRRNHIYLNNSATVSKGCRLECDVVIGNDSVLEDDVLVTRSVIGKGCVIGKNSIVKNSFIFSNTNILENCFVSDSVIGSGCILNDHCKVEKGCIVGSNVILEAQTRIENISLISQTSVSKTHRLTAFNKTCFIYKSDRTSVSESDEGADVDASPGLLIQGDDDEFTASESEESENDSSDRDSILDDVQIFYNEVFDSLSLGYEEKIKCEDMIVEINSSRYAYNITVNEVNFNVIKAILTINSGEQISVAGDNSGLYLQQTLQKLNFFLPMLKNYIKNSPAQRDCLRAIFDVAVHDKALRSVLVKVLHYLYDKDILCEEIITSWYHSCEDDLIKVVVYPLIEWLEEADEESDESN